MPLLVGFLFLDQPMSINSNACIGPLVASFLVAYLPPLLLESSQPSAQLTLTYQTLHFYERALRLPSIFPISSLASHTVKPRLIKSSWRTFTSTHPLIANITGDREPLVNCPPFPPWNHPHFVVSTTIPGCNRTDPLTLAKSLHFPI